MTHRRLADGEQPEPRGDQERLPESRIKGEGAQYSAPMGECSVPLGDTSDTGSLKFKAAQRTNEEKAEPSKRPTGRCSSTSQLIGSRGVGTFPISTTRGPRQSQIWTKWNKAVGTKAPNVHVWWGIHNLLLAPGTEEFAG